MASVPEAVPQEPVRRYSNVAVAFHWITVVLVVAQAIVGFGFHRFSEGALKAELFTWHKTIGPLILLITLARLWYRVKNPRRRSRPRFLIGSVSRPCGIIGCSTRC